MEGTCQESVAPANVARSTSTSQAKGTMATMTTMAKTTCGWKAAKKDRRSVHVKAVADAPAKGVAPGKPNVGTKKVCVITGASSGLGLQTAKQLAKSGDWFVVMANRDFLKSELAAKKEGFPKDSYRIMHCDLSSLDSVRQFVENFKNAEMPLDCVIANAAVYLPTAKEPTFTADGYELSVGTNHLGHFLLCNLLLEDLKKSKNGPKMIIVGSITGNTNTLAGKIPPQADLGNLSGLVTGSTMIDGKDFDGAKAYKDSKVCNMLTMREMHRRFHDQTGVTFASLYPGCIATTGLFRNHVKPFQVLFPVFQKYLTGGYVSEEEAGRRLAGVVTDPAYSTSGAYWSWSKNSEGFENTPSDEVQDGEKGKKLWDLSMKLVGLE